MKYKARSEEENAKATGLYTQGHTDLGSVTLLFRQPVLGLCVLFLAFASLAEIRADLSVLLLIILAKSSLTMEPGTSSSLSPDPSVSLLPFDASLSSPLLTFLLFGLLQPSTSPILSTSSLELISSHQSTESSLLKLIRLNLTESES